MHGMGSTLQKVLVVDDEAAVGDLLAYAFGAEGFEVELASNASAALTTTKRWSPDVILLDVMLPDVDGFALLPQLRSVTGSPIIFLSAKSHVDDRQRGLKLGATDYVTKPFDVDDLVARVRSALA